MSNFQSVHWRESGRVGIFYSSSENANRSHAHQRSEELKLTPGICQNSCSSSLAKHLSVQCFVTMCLFLSLLQRNSCGMSTPYLAISKTFLIHWIGMKKKILDTVILIQSFKKGTSPLIVSRTSQLINHFSSHGSRNYQEIFDRVFLSNLWKMTSSLIDLTRTNYQRVVYWTFGMQRFVTRLEHLGTEQLNPFVLILTIK